MLNLITNTVRYIFTLYFGVFVTTSIIGIKNNKKNILILNAFCVIDLLLDLVLMCFKGLCKCDKCISSRDTSSSFAYTDICFSPECTQITACCHKCLHVLSDM